MLGGEVPSGFQGKRQSWGAEGMAVLSRGAVRVHQLWQPQEKERAPGPGSNSLTEALLQVLL